MDILQQLSVSLADRVAAAAPSIARVKGRRGRTDSGIVIGADGLLVTTDGQLPRGDETRIALHDGRELTAAVVGRDPGTDLALLRVEATDLTPLELGDAPDADPDALPRVGELVLALGRPGRSVRASLRMLGVVADSCRTPAGGRVTPYLEMDRAVPTGFEGGLALGASGRPLGLMSSRLLPHADVIVPGPQVLRVAEELISRGRVQRGYLGVAVQPVSLPPAVREDLGRRRGALVVGVEADGPAEASGILLGDVLVELDGEPVGGPHDLVDLLRDRAARDLPARLLRAGALTDLTVRSGERG